MSKKIKNADISENGSPETTRLATENIRTKVIRKVNTPSRSSIEPGYVLKQRFVIERSLGEGAMGMVLLARDLRKEEMKDKNPHVAIKLLSAQLNIDPRAFIALQRETKKTQQLAHPNIITVFDFDREDDLVYMTMEALKGSTLDNYIKQTSGKDIKRTIRIIQEIANGIAYAHQRKIIHSDLKPQNVFLTEDNEVKVLDFGIARAYSRSFLDDDSNRTLSEIAGMTPAYASYEMFEGEEPHPADDVYALGLIAYELLTGVHPFNRKNALSVFKNKQSPKKISGLKKYQWQAIAKALQISREQRWQNAGEFLKKFSGVGRVRRNLMIALVTTLLISIGYVYFDPKAGPKIPFADLDLTLQTQVSKHLDEGNLALKFQDYNGAIFSFNEAYLLHERNPDAVKGLEDTVSIILGYLQTDQSEDQLMINYNNISELLKYESLAQNRKLKTAQMCSLPENFNTIKCCINASGLMGCLRKYVDL